MKLNKNTRKILVIVAVIGLLFYIVKGFRETYEESEEESPQVGPSAERDAEVEKIVDDLNISQEDLDLMFEFINS